MRGLRGGLRSGLRGPLRGFGAGGGTWTIGDTSPVLWTRAGEGFSVGAAATIPAVSDWTTYSVDFADGGDWLRVNDREDEVAYAHTLTQVVVDSVAAPCGYTIDVRRGHPPYGETTNRIRVVVSGTTTCTIDVDLDDGSIVAGTYETAKVEPLGANADAGYRITVRSALHTVGGSVVVGLLVSGSNTYRDNDGSGYYFIQDVASVDQRTADTWGDAGDGEEEWAQETPANQPVIWADSRGPCLVLQGAQVMSCHALGALGSAACSVAIALETPIQANERGVVVWVNAVSGMTLRLIRSGTADRMRWERYRDDANYAGINCDAPSPFVGTAVARYTGSAMLLRANGTTLDAAAHSGTLTTDRLWLGSYDGAAMPLHARIREIAIWNRALTDPEAAAVDYILTRDWGY